MPAGERPVTRSSVRTAPSGSTLTPSWLRAPPGPPATPSPGGGAARRALVGTWHGPARRGHAGAGGPGGGGPARAPLEGQGQGEGGSGRPRRAGGQGESERERAREHEAVRPGRANTPAGERQTHPPLWAPVRLHTVASP